MQTLHSLNILGHVLFGTAALLVGGIALLARKGPGRHARFGRYFLGALTVVVATAGIGIMFFRSNPFLLMLTLLGGYVGYSGYRTTRLRERPASPADALVAVVTLAAGGVYLVLGGQSGGNWSPAVVYPTLSGLVLVAGYDLLKRFLLFERLRTWWLYEHIYKMTSAYNAIVSAFAGTVFPNHHPYSQILPTVFFMGLIAYFIGRQARKARLKKKNEPIPPVTEMPPSGNALFG
ncbi:MAG: hypothetical protein H7Z75_01700 [Ferruginibacter sp.]|nr:hypothetical protein [Cytophagales bacterium]